MKNKVSFITFFWLGILGVMILVFQSHTESIPPKSVKSILKKMHFVEGAEITSRHIDYHKITERDTTLLFSSSAKKHRVSSFYISATEVTNIEWWEFYSSIVDELGYEKASEYYPDTLVWDPLLNPYYKRTVKDYFDYDNYPVVGISWVHAQAYCQWKTQQLKELTDEPIDLIFRLPTQYEWEHAALGPQALRESNEVARYPWDGYNYMKNGKYLANFGSISDINGARIKSPTDDGGLVMTAVGNYPPNFNGLYDMAGNVAEWVLDTAKILDWTNKEMIHKESDITVLIEECENRIALDSQHLARYEFFKKRLIHDKEILSKGDMKAIKGGAWSDGLAYLQVGSMEAMDKDKKSARVGFRVAISYNKKYEKYFPKKYWQPKKK